MYLLSHSISYSNTITNENDCPFSQSLNINFFVARIRYLLSNKKRP
jgi:hypothetical protein